MNILFKLFADAEPLNSAAPEASKSIIEHPVWGPVILVGVFIVASVLGYVIIKKVPSLLHTPLMSGMNALSGVTVLGAIIAAILLHDNLPLMIIALVAAALAMINVAGGFAVTHKMLRMFHKKDKEVEKQ